MEWRTRAVDVTRLFQYIKLQLGILDLLVAFSRAAPTFKVANILVVDTLLAQVAIGCTVMGIRFAA